MYFINKIVRLKYKKKVTGYVYGVTNLLLNFLAFLKILKHQNDSVMASNKKMANNFFKNQLVEFVFKTQPFMLI